MEKTTQEVVELLNEKLYGIDAEHEENFIHSFTYFKGNTWEAISLDVFAEDVKITIDLWNSEWDGREYNEETDEYEPLEDYLIRSYENCITKLQEIHKFLNK